MKSKSIMTKLVCEVRLVKWLLPFYLFTFLPLNAQVGTWRAFMAYHDVQQIIKVDNTLFVRASNGLYQYNLTDHSISTYDKVNGLNDCNISCIGWNNEARRLVVAYENANIDLLDLQGNVVNQGDLYNKVMAGDKTINSIDVNGFYAYLACGFGIVKLNVKAAEISESYILNMNVLKTTIDGNFIYALDGNNNIWKAELTTNLMDKSVWTVDNTASPFTDNDEDYRQYIEEVRTLKPDGPDYNYFGFLRKVGRTLYTVDKAPSAARLACIQTFDLDSRNWTNYENDISKQTGHEFARLFSIDVDPHNPNHVFAGGRTGVYEYLNGKFVKEYNNNNSPLQTATTVGNNNKDYVLVTGMKYDADGNLWCVNSTSPNTSLLQLNSEWTSHHKKELTNDDGRSFDGMENLMFDSRGLLWFVNNHYYTPALVCYNTKTDNIKVYKTFTNQDGTSYTLSYVTDVAEDKSGNIWIGTNSGPFMLEASQIGTSNETFTQVKVPRNDGSNFADYLLSGVYITAIAIDGGGRKWFGTNDNGVYLISEDNMTQLQHFQSDNSALLSDNILSLAIDDQSGEVFIGTGAGLCSYMSDATTPVTTMDKDQVYAYPNPVNPDYTGLITIVGLSYNAKVKIVTASGKLVNEGQSNGGTYTWDGCDRQGRRVASGVYTALIANQDGSKGTVCRIAIIK